MLSLDFKDKEVLITGGAGFIGSNLAHRLVKEGARVTILDALLEPYGGNKFNLQEIRDQVSLVDGNIMAEELIGQLVEGKDFIFHLAGQVGYLEAKEKPFMDLDYNGRGNLILLEAVKERAAQAKILFSSSRLVYGRIKQLPVQESHPTEPLSLYGIHKLLGEKYYAYYAHNFGVNGLSVRIPNPYGPRQQMKHSRYAIVGWFIRQAMADEVIKIYGDGKQLRDYIYIDDIIEAMLRLMIVGQAGEAYNIGSGQGITFSEMVAEVIKAVGRGREEFVPWPSDYEKNETGDYVADTNKIRTVTGWEPSVAMAEGLRRTVDFYRRNKDAYW